MRWLVLQALMISRGFGNFLSIQIIRKCIHFWPRLEFPLPQESPKKCVCSSGFPSQIVGKLVYTCVLTWIDYNLCIPRHLRSWCNAWLKCSKTDLMSVDGLRHPWFEPAICVPSEQPSSLTLEACEYPDFNEIVAAQRDSVLDKLGDLVFSDDSTIW